MWHPMAGSVECNKFRKSVMQKSLHLSAESELKRDLKAERVLREREKERKNKLTKFIDHATDPFQEVSSLSIKRSALMSGIAMNK